MGLGFYYPLTKKPLFANVLFILDCKNFVFFFIKMLKIYSLNDNLKEKKHIINSGVF